MVDREGDAVSHVSSLTEVLRVCRGGRRSWVELEERILLSLEEGW
jgi:hypothetical protein